ncbi:FecR domain-containing protein [Flammeovirgaceae bacterium SG7u.111]|nr:FecR domain-containing protein [Flammeovirgaceae bacterium SG7u.132]WPO33721.1 FecR domain-containing protein [Flammeovirgaceae bacterium SG7u.111]
MKEYDKYEIADFLSDPSFQDYALGKDENAINQWNTWINNHPEKQTLVLHAKGLLNSLQFIEKPIDDTQLLIDKQKLQSAIAAINLKKNISPTRTRKFIPSVWLKIAASIALFLLVGYTFWKSAQSLRGNLVESTPISWVTKETQSGQKLSITLQDGTKIKLNSNTKVRFSSPWTENKREVFFEGEAFFVVAKDPTRPFIIHTNSPISTSVLGTSFNMRAYPDENGIEVALVEGKVKVFNKTAQNEQMILNPLEKAYYNKKEDGLSKSGFDLAKTLAWKDGILFFENATFDEVIKQLESWYGVDFIIESRPTFVEGFSGKFHNQVLEDVLIGISYTSEFNYRIEKNKVYISK